MILTVTLNTALDQVLFIDEWKTGSVMRTDRIITSVGGKGLDSSVVLRHLGVETVGLCFVAGSTGEKLIQVVENYGITPETVWVDGETRIAHVIIEQSRHRHSHIIAGRLCITDAHCEQLLNKFTQRLKEASFVICAGSIPPEVSPNFYGRLTQIAHQSGIPILIDSQDAGILGSLAETPEILKMNSHEFEHTFQVEAGTMDSLVRCAVQVYNHHRMNGLVITCAEDGILAFSPQGAFHAIAPLQLAVNAAGAGDAVSSALAWRLGSGEPWSEALRWAAAASAATVLTEGTADCNLEDIRRIYPEVQINPLEVDLQDPL